MCRDDLSARSSPPEGRRLAGRPYVEQVVYRYLDCGNLHNGFALSKKLVTNDNPHLNSKSKTAVL
jgi:hypothetical protein